MKMMKKQIKIIINDELIAEYGKEYFKAHPKSRNHPLAKQSQKDKSMGAVFPPSINEFTNIPMRAMQNNIKQNWKDFIIWVSKRYSINGWNLEKAYVKYSWIFPDNRRRDLDNVAMHIKFIGDGFTQAGVWKDDCFGVLDMDIDSEWHYEKGKPQIIIEIKEK